MAKTDRGVNQPLSTPKTHQSMRALIERQKNENQNPVGATTSNPPPVIDPESNVNNQPPPAPRQSNVGAPLPPASQQNIEPLPATRSNPVQTNKYEQEISDLKEKLDNLTKAVLTPQLRATYEGTILREGGTYLIVLKVITHDKAKVVEVSLNCFKERVKRIADWDIYEVVEKSESGFQSALESVQKKVLKYL